MKGKSKTQKGITLIALIITIVVLLILAAVAISSITNDGILSYATNAAKEYNQAVANEQEMLNEYLNLLNNGSSESDTNTESGTDTDTDTESETTTETIPTTTSYVGYYANLDSDPEPEGIIYIDKIKSASGSWNGYSYTITNVTSGLKDYYVSAKDYEGAFGTKDILTVAPNSTGEDRFYVMALEDVNTGTDYCWYDAARDSGISDYSTVTATKVGAGKTNTANMIKKWNNIENGKQNDNGTYLDIWGVIQSQVNAGWYLPSKDEWSAFNSALDIDYDNYSSKGFDIFYWSSSMNDMTSAWYLYFGDGEWSVSNLTDICRIRLGTNF